MAKLSRLKLRKDENERQIHCLIVEDYKTGDITKHYDYKQFNKIIQDTDPMFLTKVYTATPQEKTELFKSLKNDMIVNDGNVEVNITESDIILNLFLKFTDIEIDINDRNLIDDVITNPNDLYIAIKLELDKILMSSFESFVSTYKTLQSNPQAQELLLNKINIDMQQDEEKERQRLIKELKEEMNRRLKELGVEDDEF